MEKNARVNVKLYVALGFVLVVAIIFIVIFISNDKGNTSKPIKNPSSEVLGTTEKTNTSSQDVPEQPSNTVESLSNFASPLSEIISSLDFYGDYDVSTIYHGASFTFKCNNFDIASSECYEGSGLMKINDVMYPLYTFSNANDNYLLRANDYYIALTDDYVLLYGGSSNSLSFNARVFNRSGRQVGTLDNALISYSNGDAFYDSLYPALDDGIVYYSCDANRVVIKKVSDGNYDSPEILEEVVGTCS